MKWFLDLFFFFGDLFQIALEEGFRGEDFFVQRWVPLYEEEEEEIPFALEKRRRKRLVAEYEASLCDPEDSEEGKEFPFPSGRIEKLAARRKNSRYDGKREPRRNRGRKVKTFRDYN